MSKMMKVWLAGVITVMSAALSWGDILYRDAFNDGTVGGTLNTTLDVSTNAALWKGAPGAYTYTTNGAVKVNTIALRTVYVEFTPEAGKVYTYSADVRVEARTSSNTVPFCIGFISANNLAIANPAIMNWFGNSDSPWMQIDPQKMPADGGAYPSGVVRGMKGNTVAGTSATQNVGLFNNYQIVLDTTGANWIATYLFNGSQFASYTYTSGNPTISAFGFGSSGTVNNSILGEVNAVELSMIPEPTTLGLFVVSSVGIFLFRKRMAL